MTLSLLPTHYRFGYNEQVDRLDAIRLLQALVAAGAKTRAPMDSAWVDKIAVREAWLHGTGLASALAYAEAEGWLIDSSRKGWRSVTRAGEVVAKLSDSRYRRIIEMTRDFTSPRRSAIHRFSDS